MKHVMEVEGRRARGLCFAAQERMAPNQSIKKVN